MRSWASLTFALAVLASGPVAAAEHLVCFDPGTTRLSADGYAAARRAARDFGSSLEARKNLVIRAPTGTEFELERLDELKLELIRLGISIIRIPRSEVPYEAGPQDCIQVSVTDVTRSNPPYIGLWHFWGPYFGRDEVEVGADWRRRMRYIVADYRPGVTRYCVSGHSDTEPDERTAMALSRARADNVRLELVRQGVRWADIETRAYGETQLARPTGDGVAEPLNRRVFVDVREACPATWR